MTLSTWTFPETVVIALKYSSGDFKAGIKARASSTPQSVSMMTIFFPYIIKLDMAAKRRKKHKNKISGLVNSMC
jgi:hypothetical protein